MRLINRVSQQVKTRSQNLFEFISVSLNQARNTLSTLFSSRKTKGAAMLGGAFLLVTPFAVAQSNNSAGGSVSGDNDPEVKVEETFSTNEMVSNDTAADSSQASAPKVDSSTSSVSQTTVTTSVSSTVNGETNSQQQTYTSSSNSGGSSSQVTVSVSGDAGTNVEVNDNGAVIEFEHESNSRTEYESD